MLCLSIHQPWAHAILHFGKSVENRTWMTAHRGPLLIHAAKSRESYDRQSQTTWKERYGHPLPLWGSLVTGVILGRVELVDCVPAADCEPSPWIEGPVCWVLRNPIAFETPIPYRGLQRLFEVPDGIVPVTEFPAIGPSRFPEAR